MIAEGLFDTVLAVLVLGVAVWTTTARASFSAVVGFIVFGLLLAVIWVRLAAVDVGLTEAAVGSGVTGALLLAAAARLRPTEVAAQTEHCGQRMQMVAGVLCGVIAAGLGILVLLAPTPAPSLAPAAVVHLAELGVGNAVTAVLLAYRAIDTLLEKVVLLLAVLGVWSLAPDRFWGGVADDTDGAAPGGALVFLARILPPVGIVAGVYVLWVGAKAPGGAFQGGAILAAMWLLTVMAGLRPMPAIADPRLRHALVVGPAIFLVIGLAGVVIAEGFLSYPAGFTKPLIIAIEAVLTFSIAAILGVLAAGPPNRAPK